MMLWKQWKLTVFLLLPVLFAKAQDPYFSQFYASRVYLNPAYAGFDPGTTVELSYRDQWFGVPDGDISTFRDSYRTMLATGSLQMPCLWEIEGLNLGTALSVFRDQAGNNPLTTTGFSFAFSNEFQLGTLVPQWGTKWKVERLDIRVGAQWGMMRKTLDGDFFIYSSQLDPVIGLLSDPNTIMLASPWFSNLNAGVMLRGYLRKNRNTGSLFTLGVSFSNLPEPNESLMDGAGEFFLPRRMTVHAGFTKKIIQYRGVKAPINLAPQFRWDHQADGQLNLYTLGTYVLSKGYYTGLFLQGNTRYFKAPPPSAGLSGNFLTKNSTALILNAGVDLRSVFDNNVPWRKRDTGILLGLSYDIALGGLTQASTLGVMELHLQMNFSQSKPKYCGEIGKFELYNGKCPVRF